MKEQDSFESRIRREYPHLTAFCPLFLARDDNGRYYSVFTPKDSLPFRTDLGPLTTPLIGLSDPDSIEKTLEQIIDSLDPNFVSGNPKEENLPSIYELYVGNWSSLERQEITETKFYQDLNGSCLTFGFKRGGRALRLNFLSVETDYCNIRDPETEEFEVLTMLRFYGREMYIPPNIWDYL